MRPEKKVRMTHTKQVTEPSIAGAQPGTLTKKQVQVTREVTDTIFDQVHPNCLVFSEQGRLFVGDSKGSISVWDVELRHGNLEVENYFKITHKELEGDQINQI
jgi:WD40 repeat protein